MSTFTTYIADKYKQYDYQLFSHLRNFSRYPECTFSLNRYLSRLEKNFVSKNYYCHHLDLGCGLVPKNPFNASRLTGIDIRHSTNPSILQSDVIQNGIPLDDSSVCSISAFDFIEHVPRSAYMISQYNNVYSLRFPFIELMNDIYRVLRPDGLFLHLTPVYPSSECFVDPTHVNTITRHTFDYFCSRCKSSEPGASVYGFHGRFTILSTVWYHNAWLIQLLKKEPIK